MFAIDDGTAAIVVAAITAVGGIITTLVLQVRRGIKEIGEAVNNVKPGTPTLVKRVELLERRQDEHTRWLTACIEIIGRQLGVHLPERRTFDRADHDFADDAA